MEQPRNKWCREVIGQIRFKPDRDRVWDELQAHIEDRCEGMRERGMEADEAERRVVAAMGDPVEVGKELDKAHKPWLGRLWIFSKVLVIAAIIVSVLLSGPAVRKYRSALEDDQNERNAVEYWVQHVPIVSRTQVGRSMEIDGYRFTVDEVLWGREEDYVCLAVCVTVRRPLFRPALDEYGNMVDAFYVVDDAGIRDLSFDTDENPYWPRRRVSYFDSTKFADPLEGSAIYVYGANYWDPEWVEFSFDFQGETCSVRFPGPGGEGA